MGDTMEIEKKTFEELVTKSTKYDEFVKLGYDEPYKVEDLEIKLREVEDERDKALIEKTELQEQIGSHKCPVVSNPEPTPSKKHVEQHVEYQKDGKKIVDIYLINQ